MGEEEKLKVFDENRKQIGVASRSDVHKFGYWHEVFHCWFIGSNQGETYIYLQLRSENKKDYPNLFDITAAGHLLADETVLDGIREIKEEIGIDVAYENLIPLGIMSYSVVREDFIDKEYANVFLSLSNYSFDDFTLQLEEVSGMVRAKFTDFVQLWLGETEEIVVSGFKIGDDGKRQMIKEKVTREKFVPHPISFYKELIHKIEEHIS